MTPPSSLRRNPTDVAGLAPTGTHLAQRNPGDGRMRTWSVRAWSIDGRPMVYNRATGRLAVIDATDMDLHDPPDEPGLSCGRCFLLIRKTPPRAVEH